MPCTRRSPAEARRLAARLELRHTPRHGSWLNVAEIELSALTLQRRTPDLETLRAELAAWARVRNQDPTPVHWQFTTADTRIQLHSLYPVRHNEPN